MAKKFTWDVWDFDLNGAAYVISKDMCPDIKDVPDFICKQDYINPSLLSEATVQEGWSSYQVRSDWEDHEGEAMGGYAVLVQNDYPTTKDGKKKPGWFPVWIVRRNW